MVVSIDVLSSPLFIFWSAFVLIAVAIVVLTYLERKLKKKIEIQKQEESFYASRIQQVKNAMRNPGEQLIAISNLSRDFFKKEFNVEENARFSELIEIFQKKNRPDIVKFCEDLQEALYSGKEQDRDAAEYLFNEILILIRKQKKFSIEKEKKVEQKPLVQLRPITKSSLTPKLKENDKQGTKNSVQEKIEIPRYQTPPQKREKKHTYEDFLKSIDNLDRVKMKLVKAGKQIHF